MGKGTAYEIQKAAIRLFNESGYAKVTVRDICEAADITKSTFYYHFPGKKAILTDFYKYTPVLPAGMAHKLATSDNAWEKVWACVEPMVDWTVAAGAAILSQVFVSNLQSDTNTFAIENQQGYAELLVGIIKKGQEEGQFHTRSAPHSVYVNIINIILGIAVQWCIHGGGFDEKQAIRDSVESLLSVKEEYAALRPKGDAADAG
ncbi:MAG TPA: TetR/AcrR family transcriptional regulator [Feifaniaceae bacterium]|nr:TetR/AcrR family transcriptional regulator [Feifaniaceae bacterium]